MLTYFNSFNQHNNSSIKYININFPKNKPEESDLLVIPIFELFMNL